MLIQKTAFRETSKQNRLDFLPIAYEICVLLSEFRTHLRRYFSKLLNFETDSLPYASRKTP